MKWRESADYVLVPVLWVLMFGSYSLKPLFLLDYVPLMFSNLTKMLVQSSYGHSLLLLYPLDVVLSSVGLERALFQVSVLIAMFIGYGYIRRLVKNRWTTILSGILFFWNPFVYSRIMVGQLGVLVAYLLLPAFLFYCIRMLHNGFSVRSSLPAIVFLSIMAGMSPHFLFIGVLILFVVLMLHMAHSERWSALWRFVVILCVLLLLNSYWLQGFVATNSISSINDVDVAFFAPQGSAGIPAFAAIVGMWGFWRQSSYVTMMDMVAPWIWYPLLILLVVMFLAGYQRMPDRRVANLLLALWALGLVLGLGLAHPWSIGVFRFLLAHVPFFAGFRDSHKFVALAALAYAILVPMALDNLMRTKRLVRCISWSLLGILIVCFTLPLMGLWNQTFITSYPQEYNALDGFLQNADVPDATSLYLPWETYLQYNWTDVAGTGLTISNPINSMVQVIVVSGPDQFTPQSSLQDRFDGCVQAQSVDCLVDNGIRWVIVDKCAVHQAYLWVVGERVFSNSCVDVIQLAQSASSNPVPVPPRFIVGVCVSLLTLAIITIVLLRRR